MTLPNVSCWAEIFCAGSHVRLNFLENLVKTGHFCEQRGKHATLLGLIRSDDIILKKPRNLTNITSSSASIHML